MPVPLTATSGVGDLCVCGVPGKSAKCILKVKKLHAKFFFSAYPF